jgi:hypothetical protein
MPIPDGTESLSVKRDLPDGEVVCAMAEVGQAVVKVLAGGQVG